MERGDGRKRCYYEVLEVARNASADELKVAYKKLVMRWHPDKNLDKAEEATEKFKEIQSAYAVLGDANERAWYDSHREAILRGKNPGEGTESDDEDEQSMNLWPFFSSSCYHGFGADDQGFYAVYRGVFTSIEDAEKAECAEHVPLPPFGDACSSHDDVLEFYRAWKNYTSDRSFGWAEQWKLSEAPNRQYRRAMEKDNKKKRDKKKKEFTELVRHLAEYVQKIDPRMQEALEARQKAEEEKQRAAEARRKAEEDKRRKRVQELAARAAAAESDDEEKWERLMEGNPISRKKKLPKEEDEGDEASEGANDTVDGEAEGAATTESAPAPAEEAAEEEEEEVDDGGYCAACKKRFKSTQQLRQHKQQKKHKEIVAALRRELAAQGETWEESEDEELKEQQQPRGGKKKKKGKKKRADEEEEEEAEQEAEADLVAATVELSIADAKPAAAGAEPTAAAEEPKTGAGDTTEDTTNAAAAEAEEEEGDGAGGQKKARRRRPKEERGAKGAYVCAACSASYSQRNALFSHLAATGHARPPTEVPAPAAAAPKKGGKRR